MSGREFFKERYANLGWKHRNVAPRRAIRINVMNAEPSEVTERLQERGVKLEKIPFLDTGFWVSAADFSVGATSEYLLGLYSIQEAAAQIPVSLFEDPAGRTVLDACAAPGGKTVQLADAMRGTGVVMALDVDRRRLEALSNHLERCRVKNAICCMLDARRASTLEVKFDLVLLDVPCSGNFAADRGWFERRTIEDVQRNASVQREILAEAAKVVKEYGEIVYSTCSLEPEEDELNVDWAVKNLNLQTVRINCYGQEGLTEVFGRRLDDSVRNCRRIWPGPTQGFFVCKLRLRRQHD